MCLAPKLCPIGKLWIWWWKNPCLEEQVLGTPSKDRQLRRAQLYPEQHWADAVFQIIPVMETLIQRWRWGCCDSSLLHNSSQCPYTKQQWEKIICVSLPRNNSLMLWCWTGSNYLLLLSNYQSSAFWISNYHMTTFHIFMQALNFFSSMEWLSITSLTLCQKLSSYELVNPCLS